MKIKYLLVIFILFIQSTAFSQDLCPKPKAVSVDEAPELKIEENELKLSDAMKSIKWLESDIWDVIKEFKTTKELTDCTECFGIPLPNSVMRIKGVLLRQEALLEKERLENAKLKVKTENKEEIKKAQKRFDTTRKKFCDFLKNAEWVD